LIILKFIRWGLLTVFGVYTLFVLSVIFCPFLLLILGAGFLLLLLFEFFTKRVEKNWLRFLCLSWLVSVLPTFGIMPMLGASGLVIYLPLGKQLGIFTNITLALAYNLIVPTPKMFEWDHPSPPLTIIQILALGLGTLLLSSLPLYILIKRGVWKFRTRAV